MMWLLWVMSATVASAGSGGGGRGEWTSAGSGGGGRDQWASSNSWWGGGSGGWGRWWDGSHGGAQWDNASEHSTSTAVTMREWEWADPEQYQGKGSGKGSSDPPVPAPSRASEPRGAGAASSASASASGPASATASASASGPASALVADDDLTRRVKYYCQWCRQYVMRSMFRITGTNAAGEVDPSFDFQGYIEGTCWPCGAPSFAREHKVKYSSIDELIEDKVLAYKWKKICRELHIARSDTKQRDYRRLRTMKYSQLVTEALESEPNKKQARIKVVAALRECAKDIFVTFTEIFPGMRAGFYRILEKYQRAKALEATPVGEPVPSVSRSTDSRTEGTAAMQVDGPAASASSSAVAGEPLAGSIVTPIDACTSVLKGARTEYLQLLSKVSAQTSRHYMCRNPDCSPHGQFHSENDCWATTAPAGWRLP